MGSCEINTGVNSEEDKKIHGYWTSSENSWGVTCQAVREYSGGTTLTCSSL